MWSNTCTTQYLKVQYIWQHFGLSLHFTCFFISQSRLNENPFENCVRSQEFKLSSACFTVLYLKTTNSYLYSIWTSHCDQAAVWFTMPWPQTNFWICISECFSNQTSHKMYLCSRSQLWYSCHPRLSSFMQVLLEWIWLLCFGQNTGANKVPW